MRMLLLTCFSLGLAGVLAAAETRGVTPTAQVAGLEIRLDDVLFTDKKDYVHMLWDTFPARDAITREAKQRGGSVKGLREEAAQALAQSLVPPRFPHAVTVRANVVEFSQRDAYGAPDWGSIKRLERFVLTLSPTATAGVAVTETAKPAPKKKAAP